MTLSKNEQFIRAIKQEIQRANILRQSTEPTCRIADKYFIAEDNDGAEDNDDCEGCPLQNMLCARMFEDLEGDGPERTKALKTLNRVIRKLREEDAEKFYKHVGMAYWQPKQ